LKTVALHAGNVEYNSKVRVLLLWCTDRFHIRSLRQRFAVVVMRIRDPQDSYADFAPVQRASDPPSSFIFHLLVTATFPFPD